MARTGQSQITITDVSDGLNTATVSLFAKNTSGGSAPTSFSGTFTYTFSTGVLSGGTLNGWSQSAPSISAGEYLWERKAYASSSTDTATIVIGDWAAATVVGVSGSEGSRGAGWWRYEDTSNASTYYSTDVQNRVNSAFSTAVGLTPTEGDRFIISATDTAIAFIYDTGNWVTQADFIDGNLLVNGTVTADAIKASTITGDKIAAGQSISTPQGS